MEKKQTAVEWLEEQNNVLTTEGAKWMRDKIKGGDNE